MICNRQLSNRQLTKRLYYRYYDLAQSSKFLGDLRITSYAENMKFIVRRHLQQGLMGLSPAELRILGIPEQMILDIIEFEKSHSIGYIVDFKKRIPSWIYPLIHREYINLQLLRELVLENDCQSTEDLRLFLLSERCHLYDKDFIDSLRHILTYMDDDNYPKCFARKYTENDILRMDYFNERIKGTFHNHTEASDGLCTLEEMVNFAKGYGYDYLGISDHSHETLLGVNEEGLNRQIKNIDALSAQNNYPIILKSIECEILSNGELDMSKECLNNLDYVIIGAHVHLDLKHKDAMKMMTRAIENPITDILAHPSARIYNSRPGLLVDMKQIIDACVANGVVLEINGNWKRLDLDPRYIEYALNKGAIFSLAADVHSPKDFFSINNAIAMAESIPVPASRILNTMDINQIQEFFIERHGSR